MKNTHFQFTIIIVDIINNILLIIDISNNDVIIKEIDNNSKLNVVKLLDNIFF